MYLFAGTLCILIPAAAFVIAFARQGKFPMSARQSAPIWAAAAALLGLTAVAADAYISHGSLPASASTTPGIAVTYLFRHALVILALAILVALQPQKEERAAAVAGWLFFLGILGFCGALFLRTGGMYWLVGLAPVGGIALMLAWLALTFSLYNRLR